MQAARRLDTLPDEGVPFKTGGAEQRVDGADLHGVQFRGGEGAEHGPQIGGVVHVSPDIDVRGADGINGIGFHTVKMVRDHRKGLRACGVLPKEVSVREHFRCRNHSAGRGVDDGPFGFPAEQRFIPLLHLVAPHAAEPPGNLRPGDEGGAFAHPRTVQEDNLRLDREPVEILRAQVTQADPENIGVLGGDVHEAFKGTGITQAAGCVTDTGQHRKLFGKNEIHAVNLLSEIGDHEAFIRRQ